MYNDIERCDNHIDQAATMGVLSEVFRGVLYGYYYEYSQCDHKPFLKFTLYFVTPFDNVHAHEYGDPNGFCKREIEGFKNSVLMEKCKETKNMQIVPLQYDDYYSCSEKTRPSIIDAITTNIYKNEQDHGFFGKFFKEKHPHQIKELVDHNMFYKVTFEVPFDAIAEYVTVDKILVDEDTERTKSLYAPPDLNFVDGLEKRVARARSIVNEVGELIKKIRADPAKFKRDNTDHDWAEECRTKGGLNIEAAEFLFNKVEADFEKMEHVLFNAMAWDIKKEPKEVVDTKCSHDICLRERVKGSKYCGECIQLPTKRCNHCKEQQ